VIDEGDDPMDRTVRRVMPILVMFEGFRAKPYLCTAKQWTIGYGSTFYADGRPVRPGDAPILESEAYRLAAHTLKTTFIPGVLRLCPGLAGDPRRLAAVVDWTYNLGVGALRGSTMRRRINASDWDGAAAECLRWVNADGKPSKGLLRRRQAEAAMLIRGTTSRGTVLADDA
jgi:lysozyme